MNVKLDENDWKGVFKICINKFKCGEKDEETTTGCLNQERNGS